MPAVGWASDAGADVNGGVAPDALIISVDAAMTPFRKGHVYHEVEVAVCQSLQRVFPTQPLHNAPDYCVGVEPRPRVQVHALQHGLGPPTFRLVALFGDAAPAIWAGRGATWSKLLGDSGSNPISALSEPQPVDLGGPARVARTHGARSDRVRWTEGPSLSQRPTRTGPAWRGERLRVFGGSPGPHHDRPRNPLEHVRDFPR